MTSAKNGSGLTHVKYEHFYYPNIIQVVCPFCSKPSLLTNIDAPTECDFFMDIAPFRKEWNFSCNQCLNRKKVSWNETKDFELLNKISIRNEIIWAWNTSHLDYLIGLLSGKEYKEHSWSFYKSYLNKNWFQKTKNKSDIRKLIELMKKNINHYR